MGDQANVSNLISSLTPYGIGKRIEELSTLNKQDYQEIRIDEAEYLGMSVELLDEAVLHQREQKANEVLSRMDALVLSEYEAEQIAEAEFIIDGLIVSGHLHVIAAEPNGGKTTLFSYLAK